LATITSGTVANHMGLPCAAVSVLTDECDPDNLKPVDISEIIAIAGVAEVDLIALFRRVLQQLPGTTTA
ncbi:MAG: purine-nucleoside phosphorylase, partial [Bacteroidota bacterium]